jgi:hypothetical protein
MVQKCRLCGKTSNDWELLGGLCAQCEKIHGDVMAALKTEIEGSA